MELHRLGVRHLTCSPEPQRVHLAPEAFLAALAGSPEPRIRAALVPLLLIQPTFGAAAPAAANRLSPQARVALQCLYSAAVAIQGDGELAPILAPAGDAVPLPDVFATALGLPETGDGHTRLTAIAERHGRLSGEAINWRGTYLHAVAACSRFVQPGA